jgi:phosphopantetheine--protein transferase-like protein
MQVGIDLISLKRFQKIKKSDYKKWQKVFRLSEWNYAFKSNKSAERLAGIFAAKEAAMKATGKVGPAYFQKWEIQHESNGKPTLKPKGLLSISHDSNMAIAIVIIP